MAALDRPSEAWFSMLLPWLEASLLPPETVSVIDWPVDFSLSVAMSVS